MLDWRGYINKSIQIKYLPNIMPPPIKHTKIGLWDLYVEVDDDHTIPYIAHLWPAISLQPYIQSAPYVLRMIKDIISIPKCRFLLAAYLLTELATALIPALTLSYSGQLLSIVNKSIFCTGLSLTPFRFK